MTKSLCCANAQHDQEYVFLESTSYWSIYLHKDQTLIGRSVCVLNRHMPENGFLSDQETIDLNYCRRRLDATMKQLFKMHSSDWAQKHLLPNDPHHAYNFFPRYESSVDYLNKTFRDQDFPNAFSNRAKRIELSTEETAQLQAQIQQGLRTQVVLPHQEKSRLHLGSRVIIAAVTTIAAIAVQFIFNKFSGEAIKVS